MRIESIEEARDWYPGGKDIVHIIEGDAGPLRRFDEGGVEAVSSTPEQSGNIIKAEMDNYAKLMRETNMKVNP